MIHKYRGPRNYVAFVLSSYLKKDADLKSLFFYMESTESYLFFMQ